MRLLPALAGLGLAAYGWAMARLYFGQARRLYLASRDMVTTPAAHGYDYESVHFPTADGLTLHGWFVPRADATHVLCFFHGNRGNISNRMETIELFHAMGFSLFLFDYRGYGESEGVPDEAGTYLDGAAAWHHLTRMRGVDAGRIVMLGRSLGAAIAAATAVHHRPAALVLESTFTSLPEAAAAHHPLLPVRLLARYRYPVEDFVRRIHCPILVIHSREDEVIPYAQGRRLFAAAHPPKEFLEIGGRHYDGYLTSGARYVQGLKDFFRRHLKDFSPPTE
ncbi:MAG TPA: alpha/beta hydrolase [Gammaproteobacteria bacterium]|nr:alpha/beta hydrolase [Gammaproteobacteria bacterium]